MEENEAPRAKRKRGGQNQRQANAASAVRGSQKESMLVSLLLGWWSWGRLSPQMLQQIAAAACEDIERAKKDQLDKSELEVLGKLGSSGQNPESIHRQLKGRLGKTRLEDPCLVKLPMCRLGMKGTIVWMLQAIMLPHVTFANVYHNYKDAWKRRFVPSVERLKEFWQQMEGSPQLAGHPIRLKRGWRMFGVPISLHQDGVPVVGVGKPWGKTLDIFSCCSLLGTGSTLQFNFFIWGVHTRLLHSGTAFNTMARFFKIYVWSLNVCATLSLVIHYSEILFVCVLFCDRNCVCYLIMFCGVGLKTRTFCVY